MQYTRPVVFVHWSTFFWPKIDLRNRCDVFTKSEQIVILTPPFFLTGCFNYQSNIDGSVRRSHEGISNSGNSIHSKTDQGQLPLRSVEHFENRLLRLPKGNA